MVEKSEIIGFLHHYLYLNLAWNKYY